jgi:uncharacterized membrane protein
MKTQIRIFLSGALIIVPLAITAYVLYAAAIWLDGLGSRAVARFWPDARLFPGAGALVLVAAIYIVGLLMHVLAFRKLWEYFERLLSRLPGVKIIYESIRDLMRLFGGGAGSMGRTVEYRPEGASLSMLGIVTNENPPGAAADGPKRVAVYIPLAYMFGGPTVLVSPDHLRPLDIPVEQALKLAATALVGGSPPPAPKAPEKSA